MNTLQQPRTAWTPFGHGQQSSAGIPRALCHRFEAVMRCDLSAVRLRTDPSLASLDVLAAACGEQIHLSPQLPDLATPVGVAILGHELAHVVQQRQGRVRAPTDGPFVVADTALEREADAAGLHCAATFFPGVIADPGWPEALAGGTPSRDTAVRTPVQFVVSAQQSFADFTVMAFEQLVRDYGRRSRADCESNLRNICYDYRLSKVHQKIPLGGVSYCTAMNALLDVTQDFLVEVQGSGNNPWPYLPLDRSALTQYFTQRGNAFTQNPSVLAWFPVPSIGVLTREQAISGAKGSMSLQDLNDTYLHVFLKNAETIPITWRLCLNVRPDGILQAVTAIAPMITKYPCILQIKFAVPTVTNKADTVIVYMNAVDDTFPLARTQIQQLGATLPMQARVGAMLEELIDGVGEGSEPPSEGPASPYYGSFTEVRSRVFYTAFRWMIKTVKLEECSFSAFVNALNWVMPCLGLDPANPQLQRAYNLWTPGQQANLVRQWYLG